MRRRQRPGVEVGRDFNPVLPMPYRKDPKKCVTRYCRNPRGRKTCGHMDRKTCWKCKSRRLKQRSFLTYTFNALRCSAKRRGVEFGLTREDFARWCERTGYLEKKGRNPDSMTVGRIDHSKGYFIWNIQPESHQLNSWKGRYVPVQDAWAPRSEEMW